MIDEGSSRVRFSRLARPSLSPRTVNSVGPVRLKWSDSRFHSEVPPSTERGTVHDTPERTSSDDIQPIPTDLPAPENWTSLERVGGKAAPTTVPLGGDIINDEEVSSSALVAVPAGDTAPFRTIAQGELQADVQDGFFVSRTRQPLHGLLSEPMASYSFAGFTAGALPSVASVLTAAKGHLASYPRLSDREECLLAPGSFSFSLQQGLAAAALAAVTLKYMFCERPKRSLKTFCFDFAKLVVGALLSQLMALRFSTVLSHVHLSWIHEGVDACDWYVVSQFADSSLGIWLVVKILRISEQRFAYESGQYSYRPGGRPAFKNFIGQLFIFIWIILVGKLLMFIVLGIFTKPLSAVAYTVLSALHRGNAEHRFLIVMVIIPVLTNLFQYTTLDSIIRFRKRSVTKEEQAFFELHSKCDESRTTVDADGL
ncbi:aal091cp, related [Neospora caninum Liverpool]|uniref:Aal091cp, related n=1 Tax=Neospora caninum (strain Liverpool) TaxID=572307 RepID=F0VBF7_NEOCL|nr:aal091cp, related [Neospora caninum Liverpool]CBZ50941.1 aal091cp, related [Neospora caninum Liverpool]CEL68242.1 TPA: AAL091Cp, related [Neospora caninum Liverpool]|eukprot:XP_003880974.1 aal091cp, related [Neospora caninum Liverpool]